MTAPSSGRERVGTDFLDVLTPVDFSSASWRPVGLAAWLASQFHARARVVHVDTDSPPRSREYGSLRIHAAPDGRPVEIEVVAAASAADGILGALGASAPSLLVTSTHGHTAIAESVLGSTAEQVLQRWDGPIVAAGPRYESIPELRRIVVCVEPTLPAPLRLITEVRAWASQLDLPVTVFAVTTDSLRSERIHNDERLADVARWVSPQGRPASVASFGSGSVPGSIIDFADAVPGTLIAIATHARPLPVRLMLGSVALAVCRRAKSPVLLRRLNAASG